MKRLCMALCALALLTQPIYAKRSYKRRYGSHNRTVTVEKTPQRKAAPQPQRRVAHKPTQRPFGTEFRSYHEAHQPKRHAKIDPPRFKINV